jgi:hypothetical protein
MSAYLLLLGALLLGRAQGEVYTALAEMEELLNTEAALMDTLDGYISAQEKRLDTLRRWAKPDLAQSKIKVALPFVFYGVVDARPLAQNLIFYRGVSWQQDPTQ